VEKKLKFIVTSKTFTKLSRKGIALYADNKYSFLLSWRLRQISNTQGRIYRQQALCGMATSIRLVLADSRVFNFESFRGQQPASVLSL